MLATMRARAAILCLALACAKEPQPPPSGDPAVAIAAALFAPKPKGPQVLVTVELAGTSAFEVERALLEPIERAFATAGAVDEIESIATPGGARLYVSFAAGTDPYTAMTALRDAMPRESLPIEASHPVLERADRDGSLMFALLAPDTPGDAVGPGDHDAMDALGDTVAQQPGVWKVMRCGWARPVLVVEIDPVKLAAFGLTLDPIVERVESKLVGAIDLGIDDMMAALVGTTAGEVGLSELASLRVESREGSCAVLGAMGRAHPTLQIWGTPEGIANAQTIVRDAAIAPRVRAWTPGDPSTSLAMVASLRPPEELRAVLMRWLASDTREPAWLVHMQDATEPSWLLAGRSTSLLSFSRAASEGFHMWWPGAPVPVDVRICGPELETLTRTADAFAAALHSDELLDDVVAWVPRQTPQVVFAVDREAAARHGVPASDIARWAPLFLGGELALGRDVVLKIGGGHGASIPLRGASGSVPSSALFTAREGSEPSFISRVDGQRCTTVSLQPRRAEDRAKVEALVRDKLELPVGVYSTIVPP
jgi:multidrug efflux pump subunit AcrB